MIYRFIEQKIFPILRQSIVKASGLENIPQSGPLIFSANHIDRLDGVLLFILLKNVVRQPLVFLSKSGGYNRLLTHSAIPLSKYSKEEALSLCQKHLEKNGALVIFPEGQRNQKDELLRGKTGVARFALWTGATVVPIGIISPAYSSFTYSLLLSLLRKKEVKIRIGEPLFFKKITVQDTSYSKLQEVTREIMNNIALLCGKVYRY